MPGPSGGGGVPAMPGGLSVPAPNYAALAGMTLSPWEQILQGFAAFQASRQQHQQFQALLAQTQQQTQSDAARTQYQQVETQSAQQQRYQQLGAIGMSRPQVAASPAFRAQIEAAAQQSGMPSPYDASGKFDPSTFQVPFSQAPETEMNDIMMTPPGPWRDAKLAKYSGVPEHMHTDPVNYTAKVLVDMQKNALKGQQIDNSYAIQTGRLEIYRKMEELKDPNLNPDLRAKDQAYINKMNADATAARARAGQSMQNAQLIAQEVASNYGTLKSAVEAYRANPVTGSGGLSRVWNQQVTALNRAHESLAGAKAAYEEAMQKTTDDTILTPLRDKYASALNAYQQVRSQLNSLRATIDSIGTGNSTLQRGMGAKSVHVGGPGLSLSTLPDAMMDTGANVKTTLPEIDVDNLPTGAKPAGIYSAPGPYQGQQIIEYQGHYYDQTGQLIQ